jgi:hypothetical protein
MLVLHPVHLPIETAGGSRMRNKFGGERKGNDNYMSTLVRFFSKRISYKQQIAHFFYYMQ